MGEEIKSRQGDISPLERMKLLKERSEEKKRTAEQSNQDLIEKTREAEQRLTEARSGVQKLQSDYDALLKQAETIDDPEFSDEIGRLIQETQDTLNQAQSELSLAEDACNALAEGKPDEEAGTEEKETDQKSEIMRRCSEIRSDQYYPYRYRYSEERRGSGDGYSQARKDITESAGQYANPEAKQKLINEIRAGLVEVDNLLSDLMEKNEKVWEGFNKRFGKDEFGTDASKELFNRSTATELKEEIAERSSKKTQSKRDANLERFLSELIERTTFLLESPEIPHVLDIISRLRKPENSIFLLAGLEEMRANNGQLLDSRALFQNPEYVKKMTEKVLGNETESPAEIPIDDVLKKIQGVSLGIPAAILKGV